MAVLLSPCLQDSPFPDPPDSLGESQGEARAPQRAGLSRTSSLPQIWERRSPSLGSLLPLLPPLLETSPTKGWTQRDASESRAKAATRPGSRPPGLHWPAHLDPRELRRCSCLSTSHQGSLLGSQPTARGSRPRDLTQMCCYKQLAQEAGEGEPRQLHLCSSQRPLLLVNNPKTSWIFMDDFKNKTDV